jgi:hypothetical protein
MFAGAALVAPAAAATSAKPARPVARPVIKWQHLSSSKGELPVPGPSTQQTGVLAADLDKDGAEDFVLSFRVVAPALAYYRRVGDGGQTWQRLVIEDTFLAVEAGGAAHDIDGDGDLDVVFGQDSSGADLWWWENPSPRFDPATPWKRRLIKKGGAKQHHDQVFADLLGTGKAQLVYWNQGQKALFLAEIPADPKTTEPWPATQIFSGSAGEGIKGAAVYAEGTAAADIDGDGKPDLLAGNYWFKHEGGSRFRPIKVGEIGGRIAAGQLKEGGIPEIAIAPGDGSGPLRWYECVGDPRLTRSWLGRDLIGGDIIHGHSLALADVNGDGHLDVAAAEMAKWTKGATPDHPDAKSWIFYGDGRGNFETTELTTGHGWHELKLGDFDGDGDIDVLNKPYTWEAPRVDLWLNGGTGPRKARPKAKAGAPRAAAEQKAALPTAAANARP